MERYVDWNISKTNYRKLSVQIWIFAAVLCLLKWVLHRFLSSSYKTFHRNVHVNIRKPNFTPDCVQGGKMLIMLRSSQFPITFTKMKKFWEFWYVINAYYFYSLNTKFYSFFVHSSNRTSNYNYGEEYAITMTTEEFFLFYLTFSFFSS